MHLTFSQPQVQSFSGAAAVIGVLLYWSKDVVNLPITMIAFVQLGSFALHFGSQLWVTFIAGFIMFRVLSRQTFGHVQSFLFPAFFLLSFTMAIITMTTYLMLHQSAPWSWSKAFMVSVLAIGAAGAMANCLVFAPGTIAAMLDRGAAEQKLGVASVVGKIDSRSHRAANATYNQLHMRFVRWHCYSSLTNVLTLVANLIFMYDVARRLTLS